MMKELVLVHGRSQHHKDAVELKRQWLDSLNEGLQKSGLGLPIPEDKVRFAYYGDTLHDLVNDVKDGDVAEVIVRGNEKDPDMQDFMREVLNEVMNAKDIDREQVQAEARHAAIARGQGVEVIERGPLNWPWVQGILSAIDRHVPLASGASLALFLRDVYLYLHEQRIHKRLEEGISKAMRPGVDSVVVSHSLGTVVAYNLLQRQGEQNGWRVPLFVTLGSPLAVTKIRNMLGAINHPRCVGKWFNAMDPDDVVALYPLDENNFRIDPPIENKIDVDNGTENQHGIVGYLDDKEIAERIHDALVN